ncbi:hypothetical protein BV20DRAFT_1057725 [Pilatotrama ljubarskyi]|nr:hypothetical protein BV20DRAFT_1057725 [Pilatotrama ljubarskyi]
MQVSSLPGELVDRIVDFLHDDWRALVSCALTGPYSPLVPRSEFHLSHTIELPISGSHAELLDFVKTFRVGSPLIPLVRSIHVRGPRAFVPAATFPALIDLSHLCYLRSITLSDMFVESTGRFIRFLCRLPALEELTCSGLFSKPFVPGVRLVHDVEPEVSEAAGFATRLKTVRMIDGNLPPDPPSPYRSLLALFNLCVLAGFRLTTLCVHDGLEDVEMTVYEPSGDVEVSDDPLTEKPTFMQVASNWTALRSLRLRYYPWLGQSPDVSTSLTIAKFLRVISYMLLESPRRARYAELETFALGLTIPPDTYADADAFAALARSLLSSLWLRLTRITIILESLATTGHAETAQQQEGALSELAFADAALKDFADAVRRAFSEVADGMHERTVEVLVQAWPAQGL